MTNFAHKLPVITASSQSFVNGYRVLDAAAIAADTYLVVCHRPNYTNGHNFVVWLYNKKQDAAYSGNYLNTIFEAEYTMRNRLSHYNYDAAAQLEREYRGSDTSYDTEIDDMEFVPDTEHGANVPGERREYFVYVNYGYTDEAVDMRSYDRDAAVTRCKELRSMYKGENSTVELAYFTAEGEYVTETA